MTNEQIQEAQKLISGMRDDLSLIAGVSNDADKLIEFLTSGSIEKPLFPGLKGLVGEAQKLFRLVPESLRNDVETVFNRVQDFGGHVVWAKRRPEVKLKLPQAAAKMLQAVTTDLDKIERALKETTPSK